MLRRLILSCLLVAAPASAKDLKVLTGAGMALPVRGMAEDFAAANGVHVTVVSDTAGGVEKRMQAGEEFDLVIGTQQVMTGLAQSGLVAIRQHDLAQMVAGLGVKRGGDLPDMANPEDFRKVLLEAKSIAYVDPASGGITGVFFLTQADKLGIGEQVRAKAVLEPNGSSVAEAVANGDAQIGVTLVSEMLHNKAVTVTPLPDALQMTTIYAAAVSTHAQNALDAAHLLDDLRSAKGQDASLQAGLKPMTN